MRKKRIYELENKLKGIIQYEEQRKIMAGKSHSNLWDCIKHTCK